MKATTLKQLLVTSALAFGVAGFAQAQDVTKRAEHPKAEARHHKGGEFHKGEHRKGDFHKAGYGKDSGKSFGLFSPKLIKELNLTEAQKSKFDEIEKTQKALGEKRRETAKQFAEQRKALFNTEVLDLRAYLDGMNKFHEQAKGSKDEVRGKVLAFWDSLDTNQQKAVTAELKERQDRMEKRLEGRGHKGPKS